MHVAIADDDPEVLESVAEYFQKQEYVRRLSTFSSLTDLMEFAKERPNSLDYLFLDVHFGQEESVGVIPELRRTCRNLEVIMFTSDDSSPLLMKCFFAGATGFLPKSIPINQLGHYLKMCLDGGAAMTPQIARELVRFFQPQRASKNQKLMAQGLDDNQFQLLKLLASGYTYQEIADTLDVNVNNIKYYIKKLYRQLDVSNRSEAVSAYWASRVK
ncbi:MAG: response regulator transcription factor [Bacteroidota bacterium]